MTRLHLAIPGTRLQLTVLVLVLVAVGVGIGYVIWAPPENETATPDQLRVPEARPDEPDAPPVGWFDRSDDRRADAALFSNSQDSILVIGCFPAKPDHRTSMSFRYEPFPDENVGYSLSERWTFFTGTEHGLSGTHSRDITTEQVDALLTAETLIYEADADRSPHPDTGREYSDEGSRWEGETEWEHPPAVYLHRVVFDLTVNREALKAVLDRCGKLDPHPEEETG
ncbi:MAG: hypothetical protein OXS29_15660 [bacterium]|nr:hypothetical protein [bacterium]MDE0288948.1 hypothetical protein [bacterium]MDE0439322.1 hypothetical protein [bacterium]